MLMMIGGDDKTPDSWMILLVEMSNPAFTFSKPSRNSGDVEITYNKIEINYNIILFLLTIQYH